MSKDIGKNGVDEVLKNSDNILDIEDFTTEYTADEEFEKLIRDGLDESWADLDISVSDDLIARTMGAIKAGADEEHELPEAMIAPAAVSETSTEGKSIGADTADNVVTIDSRRTKIRRFTRIGAGIAAAALVGIVGISVLRGGLGMKKDAGSANMATTAWTKDEALDGSASFAANSETAMATEASAYDVGIEAPEMTDERTVGDMKIAAGIESITATQGDEPVATSDSSYFLGDMMPASDEAYSPVNDVLEKSEDNDADSGDAGVSDKTSFREDETLYGRAYPDSNCYYIEVEDLRDRIIEYIESVEGEKLSDGIGFGDRSGDEIPLIKVFWEKVEEKVSGEDTVLYYKEYFYAVYENDMDYHEGIPVSSALNDYYTATYSLPGGADVAAHLLEMIDSYGHE